MATLIPSLGAARFDSGGELRLAERLKDFLEDNAVVWHNLPVGPRGRHLDFIVIHPDRGLLVLEAKDWRLDNVLSATRTEVELLTGRGPVREVSPFEQVRGYMFDVVRTLERDPQLAFPPPHPFKGRPIVPFGFGVVFTRITRRQFEGTDPREVFPPERCLFRDEMTESVDSEVFRDRVWAMVTRRIGAPLTLPQFDRLRALLFPEVRIRQIALPLEEPADDAAADRVLAVMDQHQEQLARSLGEGHRIVRGVAGSGKTLILAFRAEYLARAAARPVLVLCYGNGIAGRLEDAMQARGVEDRVQVSTFHAWCFRVLRTYDIPAPGAAEIPDYEERLAASVNAVVQAVERGQIPGGQYEAVLIDEAHDFEPQWLALAAKMVDPDKRSLIGGVATNLAVLGLRRRGPKVASLQVAGGTAPLRALRTFPACVEQYLCGRAASLRRPPSVSRRTAWLPISTRVPCGAAAARILRPCDRPARRSTSTRPLRPDTLDSARTARWPERIPRNRSPSFTPPWRSTGPKRSCGPSIRTSCSTCWVTWTCSAPAAGCARRPPRPSSSRSRPC